MKTSVVAKSKAALSSPHKPGARLPKSPSGEMPPAQVSADHRDTATQIRRVSHEPGQANDATQSAPAGLESFASNGEGGGQIIFDNQALDAAPEDCHDDGQVVAKTQNKSVAVVTGGGSDAPSDSLHGEGHAVVDTQKLPADAVDGGGHDCIDTQIPRAPSESLTCDYVVSSPRKRGANPTAPPAQQVSADQCDSDTHRRAVSHEPGQDADDAIQSRAAGLESFASDGEGGGQAAADNHRTDAAPEDCHDDGQSPYDTQCRSVAVVTGGGSDAPSASFHGEGHSEVDAQEHRADAVDGGGQPWTDTHLDDAPSESLTGHSTVATQKRPAGLDQGQRARDTQNQAALIQNITARYRLRIFYREAADAISKRLFAYCYQLTAPDYDHTKPGQKAKHAAAASKLVKQTFAGDPPIELVALRCDLLLDHHKAMKQQQAEQEKAINKMVKGLPGWAWVEQFKGLGPGGFGEIVAHCGDLSKYSNPAKVWKRMGLAVLPSSKDGSPISQRRLKDKVDAELHGFSPRRRAVMHCFGESLLRARAHNPEYGEMYDRRRALEEAKPEVTTKMHAHKRALRYLEKRLLRDLWRAWRAESGHSVADSPKAPAASAAELEEAA